MVQLAPLVCSWVYCKNYLHEKYSNKYIFKYLHELCLNQICGFTDPKTAHIKLKAKIKRAFDDMNQTELFERIATGHANENEIEEIVKHLEFSIGARKPPDATFDFMAISSNIKEQLSELIEFDKKNKCEIFAIEKKRKQIETNNVNLEKRSEQQEETKKQKSSTPATLVKKGTVVIKTEPNSIGKEIVVRAVTPERELFNKNIKQYFTDEDIIGYWVKDESEYDIKLIPLQIGSLKITEYTGPETDVWIMEELLKYHSQISKPPALDVIFDNGSAFLRLKKKRTQVNRAKEQALKAAAQNSIFQ